MTEDTALHIYLIDQHCGQSVLGWYFLDWDWKFPKSSVPLDVFNVGELNVAHNSYPVNKKLLRKIRQLAPITIQMMKDCLIIQFNSIPLAVCLDKWFGETWPRVDYILSTCAFFKENKYTVYLIFKFFCRGVYALHNLTTLLMQKCWQFFKTSYKLLL